MRDGSKSGGFTIQPWMSSPSGDLYQISSTSPRVTSASIDAFVTWRVATVSGESTSKATRFPGVWYALTTPTAVPSPLTVDTESMWFPELTGRTSPSSGAR